MSRISEKFNELKKNNRKALIIFVMAGDPSISSTEKLVHEIEASGADIIELGIPFSDSIADGPTIQAAANRSLINDTSAKDVLSLVKNIRTKSGVPIALMTSFNIIFHYGIASFIGDAAKAKVDGLIIPDLPPEEAGDIVEIATKKGIDMIFLVAPNSTDARIKAIADISSGFIYLVSVTGITGARTKLASGVGELVQKIRKYTKKPVAVGFGVSNAAQVRELSGTADGVIVGSAVINVISGNIKSKGLAKKVGSFVKGLKKGLK